MDHSHLESVRVSVFTWSFLAHELTDRWYSTRTYRPWYSTRTYRLVSLGCVPWLLVSFGYWYSTRTYRLVSLGYWCPLIVGIAHELTDRGIAHELTDRW